MTKIVIFGNSGSGKSSLAKRLAQEKSLAQLDLDTIAWQPGMPPQRLPLSESMALINTFTQQNSQWVNEGCYADLLELVLPEASELIYLNLPIDACVENARKRPWEPHKYPSKEAQDANLAMLIDWIQQYHDRNDTFSQSTHARLFAQYDGRKVMYTSNQHVT